MLQFRISVCDDDALNLYAWFHENEGEEQTFMSLHFPEYDRITTSKLFKSFDEVRKFIEQGKFDYDLLITDINFGGDTVPNERMYEGLEILELVHRNYPNLPIILVTGYASYFAFDDVIRAHRNEMVDWLKKGGTGEQLFACLDCETHRSIVKETVCRKCGAPLVRFRYELNKLLKPIFRSLKQQKDLQEKLQKAREGSLPPSSYEVTVIQRDPVQGPIVVSVSEKKARSQLCRISLELKPRVEGLVFLALAESAGKGFLSPSAIVKRVAELREQEEPTPLDEVTRAEFIKPGMIPPCDFDLRKVRKCMTSCSALQLPDICPFDYLFYSRYDTSRLSAQNVRTHIKGIRKQVFEEMQKWAGEDKINRCVHWGSEQFCDLSDPIRDICRICRNDMIMHTPKGYIMTADVNWVE